MGVGSGPDLVRALLNSCPVFSSVLIQDILERKVKKGRKVTLDQLEKEVYLG